MTSSRLSHVGAFATVGPLLSERQLPGASTRPRTSIWRRDLTQALDHTDASLGMGIERRSVIALRHTIR